MANLTLQVLIATKNQSDFSLIEKMNIRCDCIMANQTDSVSDGKYDFDGNSITILNSTLKGISANRNLALSRATSDIVLFADDDMVYADNMMVGVILAFEKYPKADVIIFSCDENNTDGEKVMEYSNKNERKHLFNGLKYPSYIMAAKRKVLRKKKIRFSTMFGLGSAYTFGEDTVFLADCYKKGLKVYTSDFNIGTSTKGLHWFEGYTDRFFFDKGAVYKRIFKAFSPVAISYYSKKYAKETGVSQKEIKSNMEKGALDYKNKVKMNDFQYDGK